MRSPSDQLSACARAVHARSRDGRGLPPGLAFTDPARWGDPLAMIARLPRGFGVVLRHGGEASLRAQAAAIARACRRRGVRLLIGADIELARRVRADGVHLPERLSRTAANLPQRWIVTAAWHPAAQRRKTQRPKAHGVDALVVSPIFASRSASATRPIGARRAHAAATRAGLPCYALGGLTATTARRLTARAWAGVAAVDGFRT
ncbi:MAG: thiamine phosphate synthase [Caulobacterales bacterium]|jgi:thiamine-phosphate pyrophosphorylase